MNQVKNLIDEGKMLAIESIIRSQFGSMPVQAGDKALEVLRSKQSKSSVSGRVSNRHSTRHMAAVKKQSSFGTVAAMVLGAVIPMVAGYLIFMYMKHLDASLPGKPKLSVVSLGVSVQRGNETLVAFDGFALLPKDTVITANQSRAEVLYDDGSHIAIEKNSKTVFYKTDNQKKILAMNEGSLFAEIAKQKTGVSFNFYTKNAMVNVIGTSFDLIAQSEKTDLVMKTGKVKVTNLVNKEEHEVVGGEKLSIDTTVKPKVVPKLQLAQADLPGLISLYHYKENPKAVLSDINPQSQERIDFKIHRGSGLRPRKENGLSVNLETYFSSSEMKKVLSRFATTDEFTIELWLKSDTETINGEDSLIFGAGLSESTIGNKNWLIYLGLSGGKLKTAIHTIGTEEKFIVLESKENIEPIATHIILQKDKQGQLRLYINGALSGEALFEKPITSWGKTKSGNILVGGTESGSHSWAGGFFLMALYDRAISDDEIQAAYQARY